MLAHTGVESASLFGVGLTSLLLGAGTLGAVAVTYLRRRRERG